MTLRLELRGITKQYPSVRANDGVSLKVEPGQIHAVQFKSEGHALRSCDSVDC
jgi:ABC-type uncharacterized transport system ATPase subunit